MGSGNLHLSKVLTSHEIFPGRVDFRTWRPDIWRVREWSVESPVLVNIEHRIKHNGIQSGGDSFHRRCFGRQHETRFLCSGIVKTGVDLRNSSDSLQKVV